MKYLLIILILLGCRNCPTDKRLATVRDTIYIKDTIYLPILKQLRAHIVDSIMNEYHLNYMIESDTRKIVKIR